MDTVLIPASSLSERTSDIARLTSELEDTGTTRAIVVHVFDREEIGSTRANLDISTGADDSIDDLAARKAGVAAAVDELEGAGIDTEVKGIHAEGEPGRAIVAVAESTDADRIYVYGKQRTPTGKVFFGSTVQRVLRHAPCPVVVLPIADDRMSKLLSRVTV